MAAASAWPARACAFSVASEPLPFTVTCASAPAACSNARLPMPAAIPIVRLVRRSMPRFPTKIGDPRRRLKPIAL
jgi:hypothetical protein